jgi:hypothetical protein
MDPDKLAGKKFEFGNVSLEFGKGRTHGNVLIQNRMSTQDQQAQMMAMQFKQAIRGDVPDVCGECQFCQSVQYHKAGGGGGAVPTCTHPKAPDRNGQPMFVMPDLPPEENTRFCPLLHHRTKTMASFFDMGAPAGSLQRKRGQQTYNPAKGSRR